jgi:hypothetical protein
MSRLFLKDCFLRILNSGTVVAGGLPVSGNLQPPIWVAETVRPVVLNLLLRVGGTKASEVHPHEIQS